MKRSTVIFVLLSFAGNIFLGCKNDSAKSKKTASNEIQTEEVEEVKTEPVNNSETQKLKQKILDTYPVNEIDGSKFTPVKEDQFLCLPGCYVSCNSDIPFYETQNTSSAQTGTFNKGDIGYVKECGISPKGKQWLYVVDEYTGERGWLLCDASKNNLYSNFYFLEEKDGAYIYNRKNAIISVENSDDAYPISEPYTSFIFTSDNHYMGDWNSYEKIFKLYDIENNFECKSIKLYSLPVSNSDLYIEDNEKWQVALFSPDGKNIIFARGKNIFKYEIETETVSLLFEYPDEMDGKISEIFISPDQNLYYFKTYENNYDSLYTYNIKTKKYYEITQNEEYTDTYNHYSNFIFNPQNNDLAFTVSFNEKTYGIDSHKDRLLCTVKSKMWPEVEVSHIGNSCETKTVSYMPDGNFIFANRSMVKYSPQGELINNRRYVSVSDCFEIREDELINSDGTVLAKILKSYRDVGMLSHSCRIYFYSTETMNLLYVKEFDFNGEYIDAVYWNNDYLYFKTGVSRDVKITACNIKFYDKDIQEELISENFYRMNENLNWLCARAMGIKDVDDPYVDCFISFEPNGSYSLSVSAGESGEFIYANVGAYLLNDKKVTVYKPDYSKKQGDAGTYAPTKDISGVYTVYKSSSETQFGHCELYEKGSLFAQSYDSLWSYSGSHGEEFEQIMKPVEEVAKKIVRRKTTVPDTMYVNSVEGLKVRDKPSVKSNRLCRLAYRFPVKCTAEGKKETIDGIDASWIEILLPRCEWKSDSPEYGWVFGGYLSEVQPEFVTPSNAEEFKKYLCTYYCWQSKDNPSFCFHFHEDGSFWCGAHEKGEPTVGTYKVTDKNKVVITSTFMSLGEDNKTTVENFNVTDVTEFSFLYKGPFFKYHAESTFYGYFYPYDYVQLLEDCKKYPYIYNNFYKSVYEPADLDYLKEYFRKEVADKFISYGISAEGTEYEDLYHEYWDPIMMERQKLADAMK